MKLTLLTPAQVLRPAHRKQPVMQAEMDKFRQQIEQLSGSIHQQDAEESWQTALSHFLVERGFGTEYPIRSQNGAELAVLYDSAPDSEVGAFIIAKRPDQVSEMLGEKKSNVRALWELILHYFTERAGGNTALRHLIATDGTQWYLFAGTDFERLFYRDATIRRLYLRSRDRTVLFFGELRKYLAGLDVELPCVCLNLIEVQSWLGEPLAQQPDVARKLADAYQLLSPEHLLGTPSRNRADSLNESFYGELLHLIGLRDSPDGVQRKTPEERQTGSLLENTIAILQSHASQSGAVMSDEALFETAFTLCLTWLNRLFFLKFLENQLIQYHRGNQQLAFLNSQTLADFDELDELFFEVVAVPESQRSESVRQKFDAQRPAPLPYLNSTLFEATPLEKQYGYISSLKDRLEMPLYGQTRLKDDANGRLGGSMNTLRYLLAFLDAYAMRLDSSAPIQYQNKPLLNASGLGTVLEKLTNSYNDWGRTPQFLASYLGQQTLRRVVIQRLNEAFGWRHYHFADLREAMHLAPEDQRRRANGLINALRILDPAVGAGRFLVTILNELIVLKNDLNLLTDPAGQPFTGYCLEAENDELLVTDRQTHAFFDYVLSDDSKLLPDRQRVQETLFHEKETLLTGCLFGVDDNPNAIRSGQLRLWLELLKHTYYTGNRKKGAKEPASLTLRPLPNIDSNLKAGAALVSRLALSDDLSELFLKQHYHPDTYRAAVAQYQSHSSKEGREEARRFIEAIREQVQTIIRGRDPRQKEIARLRNQLILLEATNVDLFGNQRLSSAESAAEKERLQALIGQKEDEDQRQNAFYEGALEWRYEFPQVLDEQGQFVGFDVVIGHPPAHWLTEPADLRAHLRSRFRTFAGAAVPAVYYVELGLSLLREGGQLAYEMSNQWMQAPYGLSLRNLLQTTALQELIYFSDDAQPEDSLCLLQVEKSTPVTHFRAAVVEDQRAIRMDFEAYLNDAAFEVQTGSLNPEGWQLTNRAVQNLFDKLCATGQPLSQFVNGQVFRGLSTGLNPAFVINRATRERLIADDPRSAEIIKPFVTGRDIQRYQTPDATQYLILFKSGVTDEQRGGLEPEDWLQNTYPALHQWLKPFETKARARAGQGDYWWEAGTDHSGDEGEKVVVLSQAQRPTAGWAPAPSYANDKTTVVVTDQKALLAVLNSRITDFVMRQLSPRKPNGNWDYKPAYLQKIPVPPLTDADRSALELRINMVMAVRRTAPAPDEPEVDTSALEAEIDALLYGLFGLSETEQRLIERRTT